MGEHTNPFWLNVFGWAAAAVMTLGAIAFLVTWLASGGG
jgi:Mn2+/Fe2+ NRAMP family transporter